MTEIDRLKLRLKEAQELLKQQDDALRAMKQPPFLLQTVLSTREGFVLLGGQAGVMEVPWSQWDTVKPGDLLRLSSTGAVVEKAQPLHIGGITTAIRDAEGGELEVETSGGKVVVLCDKPVTKGDRVTLDLHGLVVTRNLGKAHNPSDRHESTGITWDDVGGLEDAKAELQEALEGPFAHPKIYAAYGRVPPKGVLLWGPPGCGKTMLAKAVATAIAKTHGNAKGGFLYVKGPELLSKWVGESESQVRALFEAAREHRRATGAPAVIFIDEAESILGGRGRARDGVTSVQSFLVPMFLAEMDGLDTAGAVVLLATNRPTDLDPAVVRDGRVDRKVKVPRPDRVGAEIILGLGFRGCPGEDGLPCHAATEVFAESRKLLEVHLKAGGTKTVYLADAVNGGMLVGITQKARRIALMRDVAEGRAKARGVTKDDVSDAVSESARELLGTDVSALVEDAVGDLKGVASVNRAIPTEV